VARHYAVGEMSDLVRFDAGSVGAFRVVDRTFDLATRTVSLGYAFDSGQTFTETITFETPTVGAVDVDASGLQRALLHLHIAAGTSYYKAAAPSQIILDADLSPTELAFHQHLYDEGLREFAVTNGLPVPLPQVLRPHALIEAVGPIRSARPGGLVVPIGGGKDSMVLIEALAPLGPRLFAVDPHPLVVELARQTGLDLVAVRRRLSPELYRLNRAGARNGHVPITAIVSLIAVVGSFLYGYDTIVMAVERSASEETTVVGGVPVNHQYSKSLDFERLLAELVSSAIDPAIVYGSALRPYSELAIARAFARLTRYHPTFCSCNTVFRRSGPVGDGWCGDCPKCRFVALVVAPFLDRPAVAAIIGRDLFDDHRQVAGFAALMSDDDKPFECVGERRESAAAFRILSSLPGWKDAPVVVALAERAQALVSDDDVRELLTPRADLAFPLGPVAAAVERLLSEEG
jgi:UDP-N-acetyl-alpha-D-muramoyl-L-alanyl-L-glutamate epimerase